MSSRNPNKNSKFLFEIGLLTVLEQLSAVFSNIQTVIIIVKEIFNQLFLFLRIGKTSVEKYWPPYFQDLQVKINNSVYMCECKNAYSKTHPSSGIGGKQHVIKPHDGFKIRPVKLRTTAPGPPTHAKHRDRKL